MTSIKLCHVALMGVALLGACASSEERRWAKGHEPAVSKSDHFVAPSGSQFEWEKPSVALYSFPTMAPAGAPATLKDLSDQGQAALIEAMSEALAKPKEATSALSPASIRDALARPITQIPSQLEGAALVEGTYKQTLVASVNKGWSANTSDRLIRTWLRVIPRNFVFDGYTIVATDNQVLNVVQIANTSGASLQSQLGRTTTDTAASTTSAPPLTSVLTDVFGSSAGLTANISTQRVANSTINQQYMRLGADILPTELRIVRESERNLDIAGNTLISLTLRVDPSKYIKRSESPPGQLQENTQRVTKMQLAAADGVLNPADQIVLEVTQQKSPPSCPLIADVELYYELRKVTKNRGSYIEGKQEVEFVRDVYRKEAIELVPASIVRRPSWRIYGAEPANSEISLLDVFGQNLPLDFTNYEQARNFAEWLNLNSPPPKSARMKIGKAGLQLYSGSENLPLPVSSYQARPHVQAVTEGKNICDWLEIQR